jgi:outer membrane protein
MKKILISIVIIFISTSAFSQISRLLNFNAGGMINIQWDISKPMGSMTNFVNNTSTKGFNIDYRHCYQNNIIIGGRIGWNHFYENTLLVIEDNIDNTISIEHGKNSVNAIPILFVADYMIPSDLFIPYVGIGIGGYFMGTIVSQENITTVSNNSFHFGVSPEIGITIPSILNNFGFNMSTRYNHAFATKKASSYSWFNFSIGFSFMY